MKLVVCLAAALSLMTIPAVAQAPPTASFDVVSVKRNTSGGGMMIRNAPGNVSMFNVPVIQLVQMAYQVQNFQIVGGPDWARADRFDLEARFDAAAPMAGFATPAQRMFAMMKSMLRDRFGMVAHTETREMPVLALTLAREDGRLGPQLKKAAVDCAALGRAGSPGGLGGRPGGPPDGRVGGPEPGRGLPPLPPPGAPFSLGERPPCGSRGGPGILMAGGMPMSQFAIQLMQLTGRVVVDRTGLQGGYDLDLKFTPTPDQIQLAPGPPPPGVELPQIDPNGPSLFAALQEQLGLKLDGERGPVEVVVIDMLTPPKEN
jgi:uncharacterized protein (TIGR03435 family)